MQWAWIFSGYNNQEKACRAAKRYKAQTSCVWFVRERFPVARHYNDGFAFQTFAFMHCAYGSRWRFQRKAGVTGALPTDSL
jgi:hypothetical protein